MVHGFTLVKVHFVIHIIPSRYYLGFSAQLIDSWRWILSMLFKNIEKEVVLQCTKLEFDLFSGFGELKNRLPRMHAFTDLPSGLWVEKSWKWLEKKWNLTEKGRNKGNLIQCMMSRCIFCLCEPVGHGAAFSEQRSLATLKIIILAKYHFCHLDNHFLP